MVAALTTFSAEPDRGREPETHSIQTQKHSQRYPHNIAQKPPRTLDSDQRTSIPRHIPKSITKIMPTSISEYKSMGFARVLKQVLTTPRRSHPTHAQRHAPKSIPKDKPPTAPPRKLRENTAKCKSRRRGMATVPSINIAPAQRNNVSRLQSPESPTGALIPFTEAVCCGCKNEPQTHECGSTHAPRPPLL